MKKTTTTADLDLDMDNDDAAEQTRFAGIVNTQTAATSNVDKQDSGQLSLPVNTTIGSRGSNLGANLGALAEVSEDEESEEEHKDKRWNINHKNEQ